MTWMIMLFVTFLVMVMKVDWLSVLYSCVLSLIITTMTTAPVMVQSLLVAVRSSLVQVKYVTVYIFLYLDGHSTSANDDDDDDDDDDDENNHVYPGVIAAGLLVFIIAGILIIGIIIMVIRKKKSITQSQQTASVAVAIPPQASVLHYTYPSVSSQAPVSNQPYSNPIYAQQQTPQVSTCNVPSMTSVSPQPAAFYPYHCGAGHAAAVGFTTNQSALPDGNMPEINPPTYSACTGEGAPNGSTNNRSNLLPPDYVSACASVPILPATNS